MSEDRAKLAVRYETQGELTSALLHKTYTTLCGRYRSSRMHKILMIIIWIEAALLVGIELLKGNAFGAESRFWPFVAAAVLYGLLDLLMQWAIRHGANMTVKRFEEEVHTGIAPYTTAFTDTQVCVENHANGGSACIDLVNIKRVMLVEDMWVLCTRTSAFIPVFKEQLAETDRKSVLELLKRNNPKIKMEIKGRA